ncbi:MAG: ShlB/FhaC/HecB family hemolysin secretion/activation protein [Microcoleaceae cyanobacterium]
MSQPTDTELEWDKANQPDRILSLPKIAKFTLPTQTSFKHLSSRRVKQLSSDYSCVEQGCFQRVQTQIPTETPEVNPRPNPNQDRLIQPEPEPPQPKPEPQQDIQPNQQIPTIPSPDTTPIPVTTIEVVGSSILTTNEIAEILAPLEGRSVTLQQLQDAADNITEIYLQRGYITSRAIVPEQTISDGNVTIEVIEGTLEEIEIEGTLRLNPEYIRSRVRLGAGQPLSTPRLENQLRLLRVNPLFESVEASLRAGTEEGESILIVRVIEADAFELGFSVDNYSPPSIGSERLGVNLRHLNLTGNGDLMFVSYNTTRLITDGEADVVDFLYSFPVNAMNGTIQLRIPPNRNRIVQQQFEFLNIEGTSQRYELSYRQPFIRTPAEEFALSLAFTYLESEISINPDQDTQEGFEQEFGETIEEAFDFAGVTRSSVFKFAQDYIRRDPRGAWALRSQFSLGMDILNATDNDSGPNAAFFSWLGQIQRVQRLSDNHLLIAQGQLQLAADPLFASQQFVLGGALSLRGYRQNIRAGDNGFRFSIEDRITLLRGETAQPKLQLAPFVEFGKVWNHRNNSNQLLNQNFLMGTGIGVLWQPIPDLNIRVDYGLPLIDLEDREDNLQDHGIYFSINFTPF